MSLFLYRELDVETENTFAEFYTDPASATFAKRLPALDIRPDFTEVREDDKSIQADGLDSRPGYRGPRGGTLEVDFYVCGHNSPTTGALTETWLQDLISDALGAGSVASVGGTVAAGATTTSIPTTSVTLAAGRIARFGGAGQPGAVSVFSAGTATLLTALPSAPATGADVHVAQMAYPGVPGTMLTKRFRFGFPSADASGAQWIAFGCQAEAITIKSIWGQPVMVTIRYRVAGWTRFGVTIPSALTLEDCDAAIMAGGSVFYQTFGTATRVTKEPAEINIQIELELADRLGPGAQHEKQTIIGYERSACRVFLEMLVKHETDGQYDTLWNTDASDTVHKHVLVAMNHVNERAIGAYFPRIYPHGKFPQAENYNGLLYNRLRFRARKGTLTGDAGAPLWLYMG